MFESVMRFFILCFFAAGFLSIADHSQAIASDLQSVLAENSKSIERPSRRTVGKTINKLFDSGVNGVPNFLNRWRDKQVWFRKKDRKFFFGPDERGEIKSIVLQPR